MVDRFEALCRLSWTLTESVIAMDDLLDIVEVPGTNGGIDGIVTDEELGKLNQTMQLLRDMQERCIEQRGRVKAALVVVPAPGPPPSDNPQDDEQDDGCKPKQHHTGKTFNDLQEMWEKEETLTWNQLEQVRREKEEASGN